MKPGKVFIGTIIVSLPESGAAIVSTAEGTTAADNMYIAHLPVSDGSTGAPAQSNLTDGSAVVCIADYEKPRLAYIIGPANYATGDVHDSLAGKAFYRVDDYAESDNQTFKLLRDGLLNNEITSFKFHAHGNDLNALPGDYDITDVTGASGLHIGKLVAQLRGSPAAFIDVSNITNTIRVIAPSIESHTQLSVQKFSKELHVDNIAVSDAEAFGFADGNPFTIVDDTPQLRDEYAIPFYRLQSIAGAAADGKELTVVAFPDSYIHDIKTEPPALAKQRVSSMRTCAGWFRKPISTVFTENPEWIWRC